MKRYLRVWVQPHWWAGLCTFLVIFVVTIFAIFSFLDSSLVYPSLRGITVLVVSIFTVYNWSNHTLHLDFIHFPCLIFTLGLYTLSFCILSFDLLDFLFTIWLIIHLVYVSLWVSYCRWVNRVCLCPAYPSLCCIWSRNWGDLLLHQSLIKIIYISVIYKQYFCYIIYIKDSYGSMNQENLG